MNNFLTGLLFGAGFGAWIYAMMMRRTGNQAQQSLIVGGLAALAGFFVIFSLLSIVFAE